MNKQLPNQQRGLILLVTLMTMVMLSGLVVMLWQHVSEQHYIIRHDQRIHQHKKALNQFIQKLSYNFLHNKLQCRGHHKNCQTQIQNVTLNYNWQPVTTYSCYIINQHQVRLWQIIVSPDSERSRRTKILLWGDSHQSFNPKQCSHQSINKLSNPQISRLSQP